MPRSSLINARRPFSTILLTFALLLTLSQAYRLRAPVQSLSISGAKSVSRNLLSPSGLRQTSSQGDRALSVSAHREGMAPTPFLAGVMCLMLDLMHIMRTVFVDSTKYVLGLVKNKEAAMASYYSGKTVLITGASSGLGKEFALQLMNLSLKAKCPIHLVLSARSAFLLEKLGFSNLFSLLTKLSVCLTLKPESTI